MASPSAPSPSSEMVRQRMRRQRNRDTSPEIELRRELHRRGLRFRLHRRPLLELRREADIVFGPAKVAVFVMGCFWHGCPDHGTWPKANAEWWRQKLERNQARDAETMARLRAAGWLPVVIWEHEAASGAAARVARHVERRRPQPANARSSTRHSGRL
jgi:DNA mismatch endonuclease (patch repair protein)